MRSGTGRLRKASPLFPSPFVSVNGLRYALGGVAKGLCTKGLRGKRTDSGRSEVALWGLLVLRRLRPPNLPHFCSFIPHPLMAHDTTEIYVRDLSEADAVDWLRSVFPELEQVQERPIVTYEGTHEGTTVPVQITEHVRNGPYTSVWFNAPALPWASAQACARAAHEALGNEVLCYLDEPDKPWILFRVAEGSAARVDERQLEGL